MTIQALKPAAVRSDAKPQASQSSSTGETDNAASFGQTLAQQRANDGHHPAGQSADATHHPARSKGAVQHAGQSPKAAAGHAAKTQTVTAKNPHADKTGATDSHPAASDEYGADHLIQRQLTVRAPDKQPPAPTESTAATQAAGASGQTASSQPAVQAATAADDSTSQERKTGAREPGSQHAMPRTASIAEADDKAHAGHPHQQPAADTLPGTAALIAQAPVAARDATPVRPDSTTSRGKADSLARNGVLDALRQRGAATTSDAANAAVKSAQASTAATTATLRHSDNGGHHAFSHLQASSADVGSAGTSPIAVHSPATAASAPAGGNAAMAAAPQSLTAPLGSDAWAQALGQQSLRLSHNGGTAELTLHPRELGQLQVSLTLGQQQQAQLHFVSPHADVRAAVEAALPQLRQAFVASGLVLSDASVSDNSQQHSQQSSRNPRRQAPSGVSGIAEGGLAPIPAASPLIGRSLSGGIDIFA